MREISLSELMRMRRAIAALMIEDPGYAPIFERLDCMVAEAQGKHRNVSRAQMIVNRQRDMGAFV